MIFPHLKIAPAAAAGIAMSLNAAAARLASDAETPTGEVWVTPLEPSAAPARTVQRTPAQRLWPTGDGWAAAGTVFSSKGTG